MTSASRNIGWTALYAQPIAEMNTGSHAGVQAGNSKNVRAVATHGC